MPRLNKAIWFVITLTLIASFSLSGFTQSFGEERNIEVNGFLLGHFSGRLLDKSHLDEEDEKDSDFLIGEERLRLDVYGWSEEIEASARLKIDFFNNNITDESGIDVREAFGDYTKGDFDFRLGRQILTWGVGDLLFINDVFPKDWVSFFGGRPLEYLKLGVDSLRTRYSSELISGEVVLIPFFRSDEIISSDDFFMFDPYEAIPDQVEELPEATYENLELAWRLYRGFGDFDVAAYSYRGFFRTPSKELNNPAMPTEVRSFYPELFVHGLSAQGNALGGIVSLESGYYFSRDDKEGDDPLIPNSQMKYLVGYQRQLWEDFSLGMQYYDEVMEKYVTYLDNLPDGAPTSKEHRDTVTLSLEQFLQHQTWRLNLFTFYSPADNDFLLQPKIFYRFSDNFSSTLGGNVFGGEKNEEDDDPTFLGQLEKNDNLYLSMRFDF